MEREFVEKEHVEKELADKAIAMFEKGYNCSEAILKAYLELYGHDTGLSSTATGFGGGIGGKGYSCGAVTGAIMALGIHYNRQLPEEKVIYGKIRTQSLELQDSFIQQMGSSQCKDLISYDLTTMEGRDRLHQDREAKGKCKAYLEFASKLLVDSLN